MLTTAMLRQRWTGLLGSFVALCLAVAIMSVTALTFASAVPRVPDRLAGAAVLVQSPAVDAGPGTFSPTRPWSAAQAADLADRLARVPGVVAAVADHAFYVQAVIDGEPAGDPAPDAPLGHSWSSAALGPYRLVAGDAPTGDGEVALDRALGFEPGAVVTLLTAAGPAPYTVSGTVDGPGFYLADGAASALAGGTRLIGLVTASGTDTGKIAAAAHTVVGDANRVLTEGRRAEAEPPSETRTRWIGSQVLAGTAGLGGFVSVFVVASTFAFAVAQRRRELALLRAVGATSAQVRRMLFGEALAVGAVAALTGALLGAVLAPAFGSVLVSAGFQPPSFQPHLRWWPLAAAIVAGLAVALAGVWTAARRAGRIRPLEALREAEVETRVMPPGRWISGVLCTGLGLALTIALAGADVREMGNYALCAAAALITGLTLLAPVVIPPVVRLVTWPLTRSRGATAMLVRESVLVAVRRTASTAAPVLITIGFATLIAGMVQTTTAAYAARRGASVNAAAVVTPDGAPGLSDAAVSGLAGSALLPTTVYRDAAPAPALGVEPDAFARANRALRVTAGSLADLRGDTVAVADATGLRPGAVAPLGFADGSVLPMRVVAVVSDDSMPAAILVNRDTVRAHDPSALTSAVYLTAPYTGEVLGGRALTVAEHAALADAEEDRLVWIFTMILLAVSVGYSAIAVASTLLMATTHRRRDLLVLRLSGATRRQVLTTVAVESGLVVAVGTGLGLVVATVALLGIRAGLSAQVGTAVPLALPATTVIASVGTCLLLALAASVLPTHRALR